MILIDQLSRDYYGQGLVFIISYMMCVLKAFSMSSMTVAANSGAIQQKVTYLPSKLFISRFCTLLLLLALLLSALILSLIYIRSSDHLCCQFYIPFSSSSPEWDTYSAYSPTDITHLVFGIAGSSNTWKDKKWQIEAWWRPNITRGYLFLDRPPTEYLPWPSTVDPPFRIRKYGKDLIPSAIGMVRTMVETFKTENRGDVRWYVMAEDDTVLFVDNLVEVLGKYDHRKYYYIGRNSECIVNNVRGAFEMAFGGGGYALSYPLAKALAKNLDVCIKRYPPVYGSDLILHLCVADLGVSLTHQKGFHQIDLRGDISGYLSAHPQSPLLSLHRLEAVKPIFPFMNHRESVSHLMKAAAAGEPRLLQQTVCYDDYKQSNWSFSISWGYSAHIYESFIPPSILQRPIETFFPWQKGAYPPYMFNTRSPSSDPCEAPHLFFFDSVEEKIGGSVVTSYARRWPRRMVACNSSSSRLSADHIFKIHVLSPTKRLAGVASRRECCDVVSASYMNASVIKLRACMQHEILA
ncbi:uncharacterized protein LOC127808048 isoform X2 [Diospyros lotus]|uniref:uncharacterized protein LOC127808048 isoform X2 n=1 Tax=Diospyros lotus TaxID=55363 RepID=UPI0022536A9D|nr:uncharacterized protein LOC127808048 isoform X2 [Diospyros lotus]